jgi:hypothetical protein
VIFVIGVCKHGKSWRFYLAVVVVVLIKIKKAPAGELL